MKILYVTFGLPVPPSSGARIRDFNLLSRVAREHEVSVLSLLEFAEEKQYMQSMRPYCRTVEGIVADRGGLANLFMAIRGFFAGRPLATAPFYYPALGKLIGQLTREQAFDIVQIEHSFLAPYRADVDEDFAGVCLLSLHNIGVHQYRSMLDTSSGLARVPAALKWFLLRNWEAGAARQFDHSIVVSDEDRARLANLSSSLVLNAAHTASDRISIVENGVDCSKLKLLPEPWSNQNAGEDAAGGELIFVGTMGYLPNRDAMEVFCRDVLPLIRRQRPRCRLTIVGSRGREFLSHLAQPGLVEITDQVEDLIPYYQRAQVAVVPLRSGGGSRLKVLEAMALGRAVVSSRLGCEGLELEAGEDLLIADDPEAFAQQVLALLSDRELWRHVTRSARQTAVNRYDWERVAGQLLATYSRIRPAPRSSTASPLQKQWGSEPVAPQLSVIIPVYNAISSLDRCLDALERSQLSDYEVIVVDDHSTDGSEKIAQARCANFVRQDKNSGQAAARNRGATMARSELLFFLDSDVLVEPDTLDKILQVFAQAPGAAAIFGSYQSDTPARGFISQYKNLLCHFTHQISGREAATFHGGLGSIRRDVFLQIGGFDERCRAMEDVELGYRLHQAGHRILLCPGIQLTHTKRYTLASLVRADVFQRAVPWTRVMLQRRIFRSDLNLRSNNLASMLVLFLMILAPLLPARWLPELALTEVALLVLFLLLNRRFLAFLWRSRGAWFAIRSAPMIALQYFYSGVGLGVGILSFMKDALARNNTSNPEGSR